MQFLCGLLLLAALIVVIIVTFSFLGWLTERSLSRQCDKRAVALSVRSAERIMEGWRARMLNESDIKTRALYYSEYRHARERYERLCQRRVGK